MFGVGGVVCLFGFCLLVLGLLWVFLLHKKKLIELKKSGQRKGKFEGNNFKNIHCFTFIHIEVFFKCSIENLEID